MFYRDQFCMCIKQTISYIALLKDIYIDIFLKISQCVYYLFNLFNGEKQ